MTEQDKKNVLIAEFMGFKKGEYKVEKLGYDCDWNWIIPVFGKINRVCDKINKLKFYSVRNSISLSFNLLSKEGVYNGIIEFIEKYNSTQKLMFKLKIEDKTLEVVVRMYNEEHRSEKIHVLKAIEFYSSISDNPVKDKEYLISVMKNEKLSNFYDDWA